MASRREVFADGYLPLRIHLITPFALAIEDTDPGGEEAISVLGDLWEATRTGNLRTRV